MRADRVAGSPRSQANLYSVYAQLRRGAEVVRVEIGWEVGRCSGVLPKVLVRSQHLV
jgi:hypothetical protein